MTTQKPLTERDIAILAARILQESFITAVRSGTVFYVENDALMKKDPNCQPVLIKQLFGRNPNLAKKFASRGTYKIKKRNIGLTNK